MAYYLPRFLAAAIANRFGTAFLTFLLHRQAALLRRLAVPVLPVRGLVLRSPLDEAFWWLNGFALVAASPHFVWSVISTCTRSIPLLAAFLLLAQWAGNDFVPETDAFVSITSFKMAVLGVIYLYPAAFLTILVMAIVPALVRGNGKVFGWTGFIGAAVVDVPADTRSKGGGRDFCVLGFETGPA